MLPIVGVIVVFVMVFGGFTLAGGKFDIIAKAAPLEFMMIGGAALGALVISNSGPVLKKVIKGFGSVLKGAHWGRDDYRDLLCLLFELARTMKQKGIVSVEPHIENPGESAIFSKYPKIAGDHFACSFICDTVRMMTMDLVDPHQVEDSMEKLLEKHHHESMKAADALQATADALPALGIVAAVLGIIKTMGAVDQPPEILGKMIAGALVGTFLGVFLAYGLVGPLAARLKQINEEDHQFYLIIRDILIAYLHGNSAEVAVEIGRGNVPTIVQPTFYDLEEALGSVTAAA